MSYAFASMTSGRGSSDPMSMSDADLDALIASRFDENAFFSLDTAIAWQWGAPLPQWAVDFGAGLGDALTLTGTRHARRWIGIDGGVDQSSTSYTVGSWTAVASPAGGGRLLYAGAAKGYSMVAPSGVAASAFRERIRHAGRFGMARNWRNPDLSKYSSDAALRAAAGRTNLYMNAYGAGVTYSGVTGPCYSGSC